MFGCILKTVFAQSDEIIEKENETIEKVNRYTYENLGQTVMLDEHTREEVMIKIKAGCSGFGRYKDILCDQILPICLRNRSYEQSVIQTMTYGAETWSTTYQLE